MEGPATDTLDDRPNDDGVVHGTTLPWVRFTSLTHARRLERGDSVPRIAVGRYAIAERHGVPVVLRPVLPMVMRGLPVPLRMRIYIVQDTAREATRLGLPFGDICDPLGPGIGRLMAILLSPAAAGHEQAFLLSAARGAWAERLDVSTDRDLRTIVERAGLSWPASQTAMRDDGWRALAEANRLALTASGLWGVPSYRFGTVAVWGQDRLPRLEAMVAASAG